MSAEFAIIKVIATVLAAFFAAVAARNSAIRRRHAEKGDNGAWSEGEQVVFEPMPDNSASMHPVSFQGSCLPSPVAVPEHQAQFFRKVQMENERQFVLEPHREGNAYLWE